MNKILTVSKPRFCKCKEFGTKTKKKRERERGREGVRERERDRGEKDRIAEKIYKMKSETDADEVKSSSNVSGLIGKDNLQVSSLLDISKPTKVHAEHAYQVAYQTAALNC